MSALAARWAVWADKFAARSRRERLIVAAVAVLGGGLLIFNFGVEPFLLQLRTATRVEAAARSDMARIQAQAVALAAQKGDPDAPARQRIASAKQEAEAVSRRLASFEAGMVPPDKMQAFLEALLARNRAVELLGLKTLPVALVGAPPAGPGPVKPEGEKPAPGAAAGFAAVLGAVAPAAAAPASGTPATAAAPPGASALAASTVEGIYQHGVEIRLAGSYHDLLSYLTDLERMPQRVMWNSASLTVDTYPRNVLVLRVYTLSLDKNWLIL
jgi:MSHA biogenesis protein MshJ